MSTSIALALCETARWTRTRALAWTFLAWALLALTGCGGGSGEDAANDSPPAACTDSTCGEVRIARTDAWNGVADWVTARLY